MKSEDRSSYAVAERVDEIIDMIMLQDKTMQNMLIGYHKLLDRIEALEKAANTLHLKRTPRNE